MTRDFRARLHEFFSNRLLLVVLAIPVVCWGPGLLIPGEIVSKLASFLIFLFGLLSLWQRRVVIYDVLFLQRRDPDGDNSHYGIVGDLLIMLGLMYTGAFSYWYIWAGEPVGWSGTMYSSFGRILVGFGLFFNFWMVHRHGRRSAAGEAVSWVPFGLVAAFLAGALFSSQWGDIDRAWLKTRPDRPSCPVDHPIWGTDGKKYHTPLSPYRGQVIPRYCFTTEAEAQAEGFVKVW